MNLSTVYNLISPECFIHLLTAVYNGLGIMCGVSHTFVSVLKNFYAKGPLSKVLLSASDCFFAPLFLTMIIIRNPYCNRNVIQQDCILCTEFVKVMLPAIV